MTYNFQRAPAPTRLAEDGKHVKAWDTTRQEPFIRFKPSDAGGDWILVPLHSTVLARYLERHQATLFMFQYMHFLVIGPETLALHAAYATGKVQDIQANGREIVSITTIAGELAQELAGLRRPKEEADAAVSVDPLKQDPESEPEKE